MFRQFFRLKLGVIFGFCMCFVPQVTGQKKVKCLLGMRPNDSTDTRTLCRCYAVNASSKPSPTYDARPARYPESGSVGFQKTKGLQRANIKWTQRGYFLSDKYTYNTTYSLTILAQGLHYNYKCHIDIAMRKRKKKNPSELTFQFKDCCKESFIEWNPGEIVTVLIQPIPMFNRDGNPNYLNVSAKIPASGPENTIRTVWCMNDDIRSQRNLLTGIKEKDMICEAKTTNDYPFTSGVEITPPRPEGINAEYKTYNTDEGNNSRQIAIYVTWTYRVEYLKYVESYHIELNRFNPSGVTHQYEMIWNRNQSLVPINSSGLVTFGFIYCGRRGNYHIYPEEEFTFRIQPMPIYHEDKDPQDIEKDINIPDCNNALISKTQHCVSRREKTKKREQRRRVFRNLKRRRKGDH